MIERLFTTPDLVPFLYLFAGVFALGLGSFTTALVYRLPRGISIIRNKDKSASRSACTACKKTLGIIDLIPFFSWIFMRGKCRHCGAKIPLMYPVVEGVTFMLCMAALWWFGLTLVGLSFFILMPVLVAIIAIDAKHMIIPNVLNISIAVILALTLFFLSFEAVSRQIQGWMTDALIGALSFGFVAYGFRKYFTWRKQVEAMGLGDVKFFAAAGAWLGVAQLPYFMLYGGAFGVIYALLSRKFAKNYQFPFGPALVLAFLVLIFEKKVIFLTLS